MPGKKNVKKGAKKKELPAKESNGARKKKTRSKEKPEGGKPAKKERETNEPEEAAGNVKAEKGAAAKAKVKEETRPKKQPDIKKSALTTSLLSGPLKAAGIWTMDLISVIKERFKGGFFDKTFSEDYAKKLVQDEIDEYKSDLFDQLNYLLMTHTAMSHFTPEEEAEIEGGVWAAETVKRQLVATQNANLALLVIRDIFNNLRKGNDPFHATRRVTNYKSRHYKRALQDAPDDHLDDEQDAPDDPLDDEQNNTDDDGSSLENDNNGDDTENGETGTKRGVNEMGDSGYENSVKKAKTDPSKPGGKQKEVDYKIDISLEEFLANNTSFDATVMKEDYKDLPAKVWVLNGANRQKWLSEYGPSPVTENQEKTQLQAEDRYKELSFSLATEAKDRIEEEEEEAAEESSNKVQEENREQEKQTEKHVVGRKEKDQQQMANDSNGPSKDNASPTKRKPNSNDRGRTYDSNNNSARDSGDDPGNAVVRPVQRNLGGTVGRFDLQKLVVSERYDKSFVNNVELTNIKHLKMTEIYETKKTVQIEGEIAAFTAPARDIIVGVILWITVPNAVNTVQVVRTKFGGKKSGSEVKYKRIFNIADLTNTREPGGVFSIMECSNSDTSTLFFQDKEKREIGIGSKVIITCPQYGGKLKMGTSIISTSYPLQVFNKPAVPCKPCISGKEQDDAGWFCLKNIKIAGLAGRAPVPFSSICNGETCDRAKSFGNKNPCACFHQLSRKEGGVRNVCFKFDFGFPNSAGDEIIKNDFTSLRTTRMFFDGQQIQSTEEDLNMGSVLELVHCCFYKVIEYINRNGGWTVMGHYIRAEQKDKKPDTPYDNQEDKTVDAKAYHTTMLHNVDYLYPTRCSPKEIPREYLIQKVRVDELLMNAAPDDTRNDADDLL
ncbi:MAG: hypothetical protein SGILL_000741 [Bacillariaceae sp.]